MQESEESNSSEELAADVKKLELRDESYQLSSETASTSSSSGGDGKYQLQKAKLNAFLEECNIEPLGRRWVEWNQASERTQERYVKRSSEIVKSVLSVVYPDNSAHLWKELKLSAAMDKIMGSDSVSLLSDNSYLQALAEAYKNAASWEPAVKSYQLWLE